MELESLRLEGHLERWVRDAYEELRRDLLYEGATVTEEGLIPGFVPVTVGHVASWCDLTGVGDPVARLWLRRALRRVDDAWLSWRWTRAGGRGNV